MRYYTLAVDGLRVASSPERCILTVDGTNVTGRLLIFMLLDQQAHLFPKTEWVCPQKEAEDNFTHTSNLTQL